MADFRTLAETEPTELHEKSWAIMNMALLLWDTLQECNRIRREDMDPLGRVNQGSTILDQGIHWTQAIPVAAIIGIIQLIPQARKDR